MRRLPAAILSASILVTLSVPVAARTVQIVWTDHERNTPAGIAAIISDFEQLNPGIEVKEQALLGWSVEKVVTMVTANVAPDVMWLCGETLGSVVENNLTLDLTPYVKTAGLDANLNGMSPSLVKDFYLGKRLFAMPKYAGTEALAYNKTMFDVAGVPVPTSDWDWNDVIANGQKLVKRDMTSSRTTQFGFNDSVSDVPIQYIYQAGGLVIPQGELMGTKLLIDQPKAMEALQFLHSLIWKYHIMPTAAEDSPGGIFSFIGRKVAMSGVASWDIDLFKGFKNEWNVVEYPKGPTGIRATWHGFDGYVIPGNCKHKAEAVKFLAYLTSPRGERLRIKSQPLQPANLSVQKDWEDICHRIPSVGSVNTQVYLKGMDYAHNAYMLRSTPIVQPIVQGAFNKIFGKNTVDLETGIAAMVKDVNRVLSRKR